MRHDPRSVLTRPAPPPDRTVGYGPHPDQVVDLRLPAAGRGAAGPGAAVGLGGRPPVVVIHGGFWRPEYDREHVGPLAADLAGRGYPVAVVEYRRRPGAWRELLDDVATAVAGTPRMLDRDGERPLLVGHSAGGQLALWCASEHPDRVGGVVALAPVADLVRAHELDLDGGAVAALLGGGPRQWPQRYAAVDPAQRPYPAVPTVVLHGDQDVQVPVALGRDWAAAAARAGAPVTLRELPGVEHFGLIDPLAPAFLAVVRALDSLTLSR